MTHIPPERRAGGRRARGQEEAARQEIRERKRKVSLANILSAVALLAVVGLMVLVFPKEPVRHAYYTIGTDNNLVQTGLATNGSEYDGLVISELMPSNRTSVPDENGEYPDWIEIWNSSNRPISLKEVGLSDRSDSIRFLFPDVVLEAGGRVVVYCSDSNQAEAGKAYHAKFKLSSAGEEVFLFDRSAYTIDSVKLPIMSSDESYALQMDGSWASTRNYSPGYENSEAGYQTYRSATNVTAGALIINEIAPDPLTGYRDADGDLCDWIELYNTTDQVISLNNYALSNNEGKPLKWRFPDGAVVAPHGYYLVYCSGKDIRNDPTGIPHTNFKVSAENDTIVLSDGRGRLVERVTIDNIPEDCSWARNEDGSFSVHNLCTPALPNTVDGANTFDYNLRALNPIGVYISEVMASNDSSEIVSGSTEFVDWVEIYNGSGKTVDLSGYGLSDNLGRARKWQFPQGTMISPGEYKIIRCDGNAAKSSLAELHTSYSITRAGGEILCLADPTGRILDKVVLPLIPTNVSYGRTQGLAGFFYYDAPTPMQANSGGFLGYAQTPELTTAPGKHYAAVNTGFTMPKNTTVYYTTDGSIPTRENGIPYNGQTIELNYTTVLRARAFPDHPNYQPSEVVTGTYLINAYHQLPIISVTTDPDELWNEETGMFILGKYADTTVFPFEHTVWRTYGKDGRQGYVEMYDLDGTQILSQGTEMSLIGQYSLDMPQKSIKFRAKTLYGDGTFSAALFPDREYTEYKSFVLRNSGNDSAWTRLLDGFQSRLLDAYGTQVVHQAWRPVAVYINGVYWGHYNLRERIDRFFVAQHEGWSLDQAANMTILEASGTANWGTNKDFKELISKLKNGDPTSDAFVKLLEDNVDIENHLEYMALEMFVGNSDIGNTRFYRLNEEGAKWKWIWYDSDYGLYNSSFNSPRSYTKAGGMGDKYIDNTIFLSCLSVPKYRDLFFRIMGDIFQTFTTEYMSAVLDQCVAEIKPELELHFARWAEQHDKRIMSEWPTDPDAAYRYWETRINRLYNTLKKRPNLLWGFIQEQFKLTDEEMIHYFGPQPEMPADAL